MKKDKYYISRAIVQSVSKQDCFYSTNICNIFMLFTTL